MVVDDVCTSTWSTLSLRLLHRRPKHVVFHHLCLQLNLCPASVALGWMNNNPRGRMHVRHEGKTKGCRGTTAEVQRRGKDCGREEREIGWDGKPTPRFWWRTLPLYTRTLPLHPLLASTWALLHKNSWLLCSPTLI